MRTFYALIATQIFSLIGSRMTGIGVGLWVFARTGESAPLLIAAFFAELPGMVGGVFTGLLADRWDKRYVIMLGDVGQALGTLALLLSIASGEFALWHLYAVMLVNGIFGILQEPASQSAISLLVPENQRDRANGLKELGFPLAGVIAPPLAGGLYALLGLEAVILFDLLTFITALVIVSRIHIPRPPQSEAGAALADSFWREMLGGWHYLRERRALLTFTVYIAFIFFLINGPLELAIPYLSQRVDSEGVVGVLLAAMSFGAFMGAASIAWFGEIRARVQAICACYLMVGVFMLLYGVARHPAVLGVVLFGLFFPLPFAGALYSSILQRKTPPDVQGRVFAITGQMFMLTTPFSFLITAALVDDVLEPAVTSEGWAGVAPLVGGEAGAGMGLLLVLVGLVICLTTLAIYALPSIRQLESALPDYAATGEAPHLPANPEEIGLV